MSSEITSPTTRGYPSSTYNAYSPTLSSPSVSSPNKRQHPSPPEDAPPIEGKLKRVRRKLDFDDPELFNPWKAVSEPGLNKIFPEDFYKLTSNYS